jgi:hypothetical protein
MNDELPGRRSPSSFQRHPIVVAIAAYFKKNGAEACDSTTLGPPAKHNRFLQNRLHAAFQAGWDAALDAASHEHDPKA